jgi:hypothetical protein
LHQVNDAGDVPAYLYGVVVCVSSGTATPARKTQVVCCGRFASGQDDKSETVRG